mmetsp:Transcript_562/g.838  ORF Transcript_562/g.838 Transcript_562/m.838 type:complete len:317 (+) Transcript_562:4358-5308(+)
MEYELPLLGLKLPWFLDCFVLFVGLLATYRALLAVYLTISAQFKKVDLTAYGKGTWAIVTGSTDGIGKGFVEVLAGQGFNIYSISRNPEKLQAVASEIEEKYKVRVHSRAWDFSNCATKLHDFVEVIKEDLKSKDVSILVNNVGLHTLNRLHKHTRKDLSDNCSVNCMAVTFMTRLVLPLLKSRSHKSAIINLSSLASISPTPGSSVYGATKRFDSAFTKLIGQGYTSPNLTVMNLRPGYVVTPMNLNLDLDPNVKVDYGKISPKQCAEAALRDLGSAISFVGHINHKLSGISLALIPECVTSFLTMKLLSKSQAS